ncbi:MAG: LAGLIDADG family homing endonuclease [Candidatus Bathyarchaeia archaeon]
MKQPTEGVEPQSRPGGSSRLAANKAEFVQRLVKNGMSLRKVAKQTGISYTTAHRCASQFSKKQSSIDFDFLSEREIGYIVGFFVGDGSRVCDKRTGHYGAQFGLDARRDSEITSFLRKLFEKSGKRVTLYSEGNWLVMRVYSKKFLTFLERFVSYEDIGGQTKKVLTRPFDWSCDFSFGFLGGLIDADGHVYRNKRRSGHFGADITTVNTRLVGQLVDLFSRMGLKPKVVKAHPSSTSLSKKATYYVRLNKSEFSKVCGELICVKHDRCGCDAKRF